ncbi:MAG TPA: enolase C-terminal domain-like protein [Spirochaetia bacterium]|nr:enolase C-terminal domain-like protein [Spirochaetia bacterium]
MKRGRDVRVKDTSVYFIPITTRVPLKYGTETVTSVTVCRVRVTVEAADGARAEGWGETPLAIQWVWPGTLPYDYKHNLMKALVLEIASVFSRGSDAGHPIEVGSLFQREQLPLIQAGLNRREGDRGALPWLAALVAFSPFDIALHDAYGNLNGVPIYSAYNADYMNRDLSTFVEPADGSRVSFRGKYPKDFLVPEAVSRLRAWHLVGGLDRLEGDELSGDEPEDGYPVLLRDWIRRDGLRCLKVKLRGNDLSWDYERIARVGAIAEEMGVEWLSTDFNCTVQDPEYVVEILDRLMTDRPRLYGMILYVEQPFPYDLQENQIDVHAISARKPLFMDESAHDWSMIRLGRALGWTGVALKTCKTQTGALLSQSWAKAHGMSLMVQDLTNPMLAQIPHVLLAAHAGTIMGVETNAMQYYPEASLPEAEAHPGLYSRNDGTVDLSSLGGTGFGYHIDRIHRSLPATETVSV